MAKVPDNDFFISR